MSIIVRADLLMDADIKTDAPAPQRTTTPEHFRRYFDALRRKKSLHGEAVVVASDIHAPASIVFVIIAICGDEFRRTQPSWWGTK